MRHDGTVYQRSLSEVARDFVLVLLTEDRLASFTSSGDIGEPPTHSEAIPDRPAAARASCSLLERWVSQGFNQDGHMFGFGELRELERRLRNRKVLSVFVDASVADRGSWRAELNRALFRLEAASPQLSNGERTARELCIAHLRTLLEGVQVAPGWPAWVAYVTTDDVVASGPVRARVATGVFWQTGIVVRPLRAGLPESSVGGSGPVSVVSLLTNTSRAAAAV
jgi:hypothetical protein